MKPIEESLRELRAAWRTVKHWSAISRDENALEIYHAIEKVLGPPMSELTTRAVVDAIVKGNAQTLLSQAPADTPRTLAKQRITP
jgi:hypothetical protein